MADIAAGDLTYTKREGQDELTGSSKYRAVYSVAFGDGTDTYPSGGIPLTKGNLGLPNAIESLTILEDAAGNGYVYKYDDSAATIRIYQGDFANTDAQPLTEFVAGTTAVPATTLIVDAIGW